MRRNFIAAIVILLLLATSISSWSASESETTYNLINYMGPSTKDSTWLYSGRDWEGDPAFTRVQIISENETITSYTDGNAATPYETNVINSRYDSGWVNQDGSFHSTDSWNEYENRSQGFLYLGSGDDEPGTEDDESLRVDGGLNFGSSLAIGKTTTSSASFYSSGTYIGELNASISLIDVETITVPARVFHNCLHLRFIFLGPGFQQTHDAWWAEGVGTVKMIGVSGDGSGRLRELESWSSPNKETYYRDFDGDGYGNPEIPLASSLQPSGYISNSSDCDDNDSTIHPGAQETWEDGIDQDCDGFDSPVLLTQTQVSQLYVSIFGRASEGEGNIYWQTNQADMVSTANVMLGTDAAKDYFGTTMDDDQAFIEHIYENTLGKTIVDDPDGIAYWVADLVKGKSRGEVIVSMINAAQEPINAGNAQDQFYNKVEISNYVADNIFEFNGDFDQFINYIQYITHDHTTVDFAKEDVDAFNEKSIPEYQTYGLNFSPYIDGQDPNTGSEINEQQLRTRMEIIRPYTEWVRTFGTSNGLEKSGSIAHTLNLKAAIGAWISSDINTNEQQIENLITVGKAGEADMLIVGSEVILRDDLSENALINYINRVKKEMPALPVTYADVYGELLAHPNIINAVDIVLVNYYPYWEGISIDLAMATLNGWHTQVKALANGKQVIVSETGWPTDGDQIGNAIPSLDNANLYFLNFVSWSRANDVDYFYFEAFDESWKAAYEGNQGAHWGIWDKTATLKPGMERVFNGETMEDNWSDKTIPGGPGDPEIVFTHVPPFGNSENLEGQVWHVNPADYKIAVYIYISGWWTKPTFVNPLTTVQIDGSWITDITTGGVDHRATRIAAFLLPNDYNPPSMGGEETFPSELNQNAVTNIEVIRNP